MTQALQPSGAPARVLLAAELPLDREAVGAMLDTLGHRHDTAADGPEALARIDHALVTGQPYDLVLMDARMAATGGLEAVRRLRAFGGHARTPIVGLTPDILAQNAAGGFAAGVDVVLHQPLRIEELRVAIEALQASAPAEPAAAGDEPAPKPAPSLGQKSRYAQRRADMLDRINALVGGGDFAPDVLEEIVGLARRLAELARECGDPATGDLAYALEECVSGFAAGGESALRQAAAALRRAA